MSALTSLARALAVEAERAQLIRTVRHVHISDRPLVLIPLQLAGEAAAPLAVCVGDDRDKPRLLVVAEPRNRTQRFEFAATLAEDAILPYLEGYAVGELAEREIYPDAPQILVPNPGGVKFTQLLGRSTRFRRTDGDYPVRPSVPLLGRWLSYYAERALHPVSALLLPVTSALAAHWATGQSATEDQNLAAILGWIAPPPGTTGPAAALAAENPSAWPPAGPATDPGFDRGLDGLLKDVRAAVLGGNGAELDRARTALEAALRSQVEPTWDLMWRAVDLLRSLPAGGSVARRWEADRWSFTGQVSWIRAGGAPQARRDSAVSAARRLDRLEREQQQLAVQQAYDDPLVMAEHRMSGEAFQGVVVTADPGRQDTSGKRPRLRPWITVETSDEVAAERGADLRRLDRPRQKAEVIDVARAGERTHVILELQSDMGQRLVPLPGSVPSEGDTVLYTALREEFQPSPDWPPPELTPWTHGGPPPEYVPGDEDATEAWD